MRRNCSSCIRFNCHHCSLRSALLLVGPWGQTAMIVTPCASMLDHDHMHHMAVEPWPLV